MRGREGRRGGGRGGGALLFNKYKRCLLNVWERKSNDRKIFGFNNDTNYFIKSKIEMKNF